MRHVLLVALAASLGGVGVPTGARAQVACQETIKMPEVGAWSEYEVTFPGERYTMRYAVLGQEVQDSQTLTRLELSIKTKDANRNAVYQVLVPEFPYQVDDAREIIFKSGKNDAMKVGSMTMRMARTGLEKSAGQKFADLCRKIKLVKSESRTVPAGTFQTAHYVSDPDRTAEERVEVHIWTAPNVPFGLVQTTGRDYELVLYRYGKNAKSSITETPKEMP